MSVGRWQLEAQADFHSGSPPIRSIAPYDTYTTLVHNDSARKISNVEGGTDRARGLQVSEGTVSRFRLRPTEHSLHGAAAFPRRTSGQIFRRF
eukprot:211211-Prymnesium_polylepis.1